MNPFSNQFDAHVNVNMNNQYWLQVCNNYIQMNQKRPVGVFWDIENCSIPKNVSASLLVEKIRQMVAKFNFIENEFVVVCDVFGVANNVLTELHNMQVNVIHVCSFSKNASDEKLKQLMLRFVNTHGQNCAIMLFSSDINFAPVLTDFKHRIGVFVILFHHQQVSPALIASSSCHYNYDLFCSFNESRNFSIQQQIKQQHNVDQTMTSLIISNLPKLNDEVQIRALLIRITSNAGGRVTTLDMENGEAIVKFKCQSDAARCLQRVNNRKFYNSVLKARIDCRNNRGRNFNPNRSLTSGQAQQSTSQSVDIAPNFESQQIIPHKNIQQANSCMKCVNKNRKLSINENFLFQNHLLNVHISLKTLTKKLTQLLIEHSGKLPLNALPNCWLNNFLEEFDTTTEPKVSLEHLVGCVPNVFIANDAIQNTGETVIIKFIVLNPGPITNEANFLSLGRRRKKRLLNLSNNIHSLLMNKISNDTDFKFPVIKLKNLEQEYLSQFNENLNYQSYNCSSLLELVQLLDWKFKIYYVSSDYYIAFNFKEQLLRFINNLIPSINYLDNDDLSAHLIKRFHDDSDISTYGVCFIEDLLDAILKLKLEEFHEKNLESSKLLFLKNIILNHYIACDDAAVLSQFHRIIPKLKETLRSRPSFSIKLLEFHEAFVQLLQVKSIDLPRSYLQTSSLLLNYGQNNFEIIPSVSYKCSDLLILNTECQFIEMGQRFLKIFQQILMAVSNNFPETQNQNYGVSIYKLLYYYYKRYGSIDLNEYRTSNFIKLFEKICLYFFKSQTAFDHCLIYTLSDIYLFKFVNQWKQNVMHHLFIFLFRNSSKTISYNDLKQYFQNRFGFFFGISLMNEEEICTMFKLIKNGENSLSIKFNPIYEFASMCLAVMLLHEKIVSSPTDLKGERPKWTLIQLENEFYDHFGISMNYLIQNKQLDYVKLFSSLKWLFEIEFVHSTNIEKTICIKPNKELLANIDLLDIPSCNYCQKNVPIKISNDDIDSILMLHGDQQTSLLPKSSICQQQQQPECLFV